MTLEYRTPTTGTPRIQRVMRELEINEALGAVAIAVKVVIGVPMCLIGPLFVTGLIRMIVFPHFSSPPISFSMLYLLSCVAVIPMLLWLERRSQGQFASEAASGLSSASSYGEYQVNRFHFLWIFYTEIALLGPRLIWNVIDSHTGASRPSEAVRGLAASIVVQLFDADESIQIRQLKITNASPAELVQAIQYLKNRDWIDMSSKRDRVWLSSLRMDKLQRLLREPAASRQN